MSLLHFLLGIPALLGLSAGTEPPRPARAAGGVVIAQTTTFRIPVRRHSRAPQIEWQEHKGPKCLPAVGVAGAMLAGRDAIDFVMRDRQRFRARIDADCTALDFYDGFYVQPQDQRLCAKRDEIRSRMGASCRIERFRTLVPTVRR